MLLACKDIGKAFGVNVILEGVSFLIEEKEKCAIVGVNGAGKTTLFKIITNQLAQDTGEVIFPKEATMGYLAQVSDLNDKNTVYGEMLTVFLPVIEMEENMRRLEMEMSSLSGAELEAVMARYSRLTHDFENMKGYEYKSRIRGVIKGLGFADEESEQLIGTFSGGQKTRIAMAKLLLTTPDLLLLDEPTNHLDIEAIQWLEDFLKSYTGGVILISHDRYFLDKIATKVIEIENKKVSVYGGNYTYYAHKKEIDREIALKHYVNQQKVIKQQEEAIKLLKSFNREKSVKRAESKGKMLHKMERVEKPDQLPDTMRVLLSPKRESGNDVLFIEGIAKSFDGETLFENIHFQIHKGDKTALIGPNGIGKTTLLRIILGKVQADCGKVKFGSQVVVGYYDQEHQNIDADKTIFREISDAYPKLTVGEIRNALASFIFTGDDVFKPISTLSGGERGRVALAKIMLGNANFLILDEPTNHLDIFSKEILEEALKKYTGTIFYISHDRYFINNTATKIIELTSQKATTFLGNYDDMAEKKSQWAKEETQAKQLNQQQSVGLNAENSDTKDEWRRKKEMSADRRKLKALMAKTEKEIAKLEADIKKLDEQLALSEINTDPVKLTEVYDQKVALEQQLETLYEAWEDMITEEC